MCSPAVCVSVCVCVTFAIPFKKTLVEIQIFFPPPQPQVSLSLALTAPRLKEIFLNNKDLFLREKACAPSSVHVYLKD